jgi:hypothetical protein
MTKSREALVAEARAALIVAAMRRTVLTYEELGKAIGMSGVDLRNQMRHVLDELSVQCNESGYPSLAALVVSKHDGKPGSGWEDGARPWYAEVRRVYAHWLPV